MNFVDLNRQFMPYENEQDWELRYSEFGSEGYFGAETWDELLAHNRVVVLAEAGAGKTAELRAASERINDPGKTEAFYITLNSVAERGLIDAFETNQDQERFYKWRESDSIAWFFVDSLDEARLNGATFQKALSNLQKDLKLGLDRSKILVSCRVSDWRSVSDTADFKRYLGCDVAKFDPVFRTYENSDDALLCPIFSEKQELENEDENEENPAVTLNIHVVALTPLSREQASLLALAAGVENTDAFLLALHRADASDLANRPQDLLSMARQWISTGTVGTKHTALQWSIEERLRETNLDLAGKDTLTFEKAYKLSLIHI